MMLTPAKASTGKYGYQNDAGAFVIPPQFDEALPFNGITKDTYAIVKLTSGKYSVINQKGKAVWKEDSLKIEFIEEAEVYREYLHNGKFLFYQISDNMLFDFIAENEVYWESYFTGSTRAAEDFTVIKSSHFPNHIYGLLTFQSGSVILSYDGKLWDCLIPYCTSAELIAHRGYDFFLCLGERDFKSGAELYSLYDEKGKKLLSAGKDFLSAGSELLEKVMNAVSQKATIT